MVGGTVAVGITAACIWAGCKDISTDRGRNMSQAVITWYITICLISHQQKVLTNALIPLLNAFGNVKTPLSPNVSRHWHYLELHYNNWGILLQKVMAQKLNKLHLNRLSHKEQCVLPTFNRVMSEEHNHFNLENPLDYAFLSLSGCYWLPYGPFSDNSITVGDLHVAKHTLGFKPKHMSGIFRLLVTILMLGNIQFLKANHQDISAYIYNLQSVDITTQLLGVSSKDLNQTFTNKTNYVH